MYYVGQILQICNTIIRVFKRTLYFAEQLLMFISSVLQQGLTPLPVDHGLVDQLFL